MSDTTQWCELHRGKVSEVNLLFQRKKDGVRLDGKTVCIRCLGLLKQAGLIKPIDYAGHDAYELKIPEPQRSNNGLPYVLNLSHFEVIWLRAQGFKLIKEEVSLDGSLQSDSREQVSSEEALQYFERIR